MCSGGNVAPAGGGHQGSLTRAANPRGLSTPVCCDGEQAVGCNGEAEATGHATVVEGPFSSHDGNICIR